MGYNQTRSGQNNVAEYMASGLPWTTSSTATTSPMRYDLPYVTSEFTVTNVSGATNIFVGFTQTGVNTFNRHVIPPGASVNFQYRVKTLFIRSSTGTCDYSLSAGLTTILPQDFPVLTSSGIYNSGSGEMSNQFGYSTGLG